MLFFSNLDQQLLTWIILVLISMGQARRRSVKSKACPNPGNLENGRRTGNNFGIGRSVRFTCQSGFMLRGSSVRKCLKNKQWSGSVAVCDDGNSDCSILGTPVSGIKIGNRYSFGSTVRFACNQGYIIQGSRVRRCRSNGKWSGTETKCIDEFYYFVKEVNDTALILRKKMDTLLEYTCSGVNSVCNITGLDSRGRDNDFGESKGLDVLFVLDASTSIKTKEFRLAKQFAIRIVKQLGATWKPRGTRIAAIVYGTTPKLEFNFGDHAATTLKDVIKKLKKIRKHGRATATRAALNMARTTVFVEKNSKRERVMFFITDGRSNIGGPPEKAARILREKYKVKITAIGVGENVNIRELYAIAHHREDAIVMKDYKALDDAMKKAVATTYDYTSCGEKILSMRGRVVGGNKVEHGAWPWHIGIYLVNKGGKLQLQCGGALVSKRWILTAAHCFYVSKNGIQQRDNRPPQSYIVRAGDTDRTIKEESQQEIKAAGIFVHRAFDALLYNNDIALVKLSKEVKLGPFVRTVCLPKSKKEDLLTPGRSGIVAGWGATQILQPSQIPSRSQRTSKILLQSEFAVQSDKLCRSKTRFNFNSTVTFCAGDGKGGNDTCKGDSGGSFVRKVLRDGGYRWVTAGLVSWGEGCGLRDKYGYYARVAPFVDWIKSTMRFN